MGFKIGKMENNIEILEFNSVGEAESEYLKRHNEGCWVMVDRLKVVWSWKKMKSVCRFSMKRVDKRPMDIVEIIGKLIPAIKQTNENLVSAYRIIRKRKIEMALQRGKV